MKIENRLFVALLICLTLIVSSSCSSDDKNENTELVLYFDCSGKDTIEVFTLLPDMPFYGDLETDLSDYILSEITIASIEDIEAGTIRLRVLVFDTGEPCLSEVFGDNVPEESLLGYASLIENMDNWVPGKFSDEAVHAYTNIIIKIVDGVIESVTY